jgi:Cu-processing system permease protein
MFIALLISHDAIVGEMERGTMLLLLSYPVGRWQVLIGKFVGHLGILAFATVLGYGAAALALAVTGAEIDWESWMAFAAMIGASVLLARRSPPSAIWSAPWSATAARRLGSPSASGCCWF